MQSVGDWPSREANGDTSYVFSTTPIRDSPCECVDCRTQFYTENDQVVDRWNYVAEVLDAQAEKIIGKYVSQIRDNREYLRRQCEANGDRILSRWRKKSREHRANLLLQVDPDLYPHQWFVPRYAIAELHWKDTRAHHRKHCLLPSLSLELLKTDPAVLFGLLHNRTHYTPEDWVPFDNKELNFGWNIGLLDVDYCGRCVVVHGSRFGQLVDWDKDKAHRFDIVGIRERGSSSRPKPVCWGSCVQCSTKSWMV
ncbi:hypothetical protein NA57DRAFT_58165 [Rhizodiscina lignyota]|uniref:Uncharacterized protein n=1 Tax=Rhizodiscina lignyota TaxID=1504668 RepID=A0A9P4IE54_9PEZI|nr:hypothetical protein NA57DRAFT_58165 [Rhizodiscina lignyota]